MQFDISTIYTVVLKNESDIFDYHCTVRPWDGFVLFTSGRGTLTQRGQTYALTEGCLVLLRRGDTYRFYFPAPCSYVTAAFDLGLCAETEGLPAVVPPAGENTRRVLQAASCWARQANDSFMRTKILLLSLYTDLLAGSGAAPSASVHPAVRQALAFLHEHYTRRFSAEEIAAACHISPSELRVLFSRAAGMTITAYRDELRMQRAKELLRFSDSSVKEVADMLGYCDVYHFSKVFRRLTGKNPGAYARKATE